VGIDVRQNDRLLLAVMTWANSPPITAAGAIGCAVTTAS
jgi:hypothetical protein